MEIKMLDTCKRFAMLGLPLACPTFAQDVWVVAADGSGDFLDVQSAVNAASQRDTVLVESGVYPGFTIANKGIQVVEDANATVRIDGVVTVRNLPWGRDVFLSGLAGRFVLGNEGSAATGGGVLLEDCTSWAQDTYYFHPLVIESNLAFALIVGGSFAGEDHSVYLDTGNDGGNGLFKDSTDFTRVVVYHASFAGGGGSPSLSFGCSDGGDGGDAVRMRGGKLIVEQVTAAGGAPGDGCPAGAGGEDFAIVPPATMAPSQTDFCRLTLPHLLREGEAFDVTFLGTPGTQVSLIESDELQDRDLGPSIGVLVPQSPISVAPLGVVPPNGVLVVPMTAPQLAPGEESRRWFYQGMVVQSGSRYLSNPSGLVVVDDSF